MIMRKVKTRSETNWQNFITKAEQFIESATDAYRKGNWNAVGLNTVHAAICANDALTVHLAKERSASEKHSDAVSLLIEVSDDKQEAEAFARHILWLINKKNLIEYEARLFQKKEAEEAIKHAERFLDWVKVKLEA